MVLVMWDLVHLMVARRVITQQYYVPLLDDFLFASCLDSNAAVRFNVPFSTTWIKSVHPAHTAVPGIY